MAAREKPVPEGRPIKLKVRTTKVTNVNQAPEQHGNDRVPRCDVSLAFSCTKDDVDQILVVEGGSERLWNRELLILPELVGWHAIDAAFEGEAKIARMNGPESEEFEKAVLKKIEVRLDPSREVEVKAQLRVDSDGEAEFLQRIHCAGLCKFSFTGRKLIPPKAPDAGGPGQTDLVDEASKETPPDGNKPKPRRGRKVH